MSQAGIINTTSGPVPPSVPTQFTADDATIGIPVANNFNLFSNDTIANNDNGIQTTTIVNGSQNHYTQLTNRISVSTTTSDGLGQNQTVTLFTPSNATAHNFECNFIAYDAANNEAGGGDQQGISRKASNIAAIVNVNDTFDQSDAGLDTIDWNVIASGGDLQAQVIGVAGRTITWKITFSYDQTP